MIDYDTLTGIALIVFGITFVGIMIVTIIENKGGHKE